MGSVVSANALSVSIVAIVFEQGMTAKQTLLTALQLSPKALCCVVLPPEAELELVPWWNEHSSQDLLVLRDDNHSGLMMATNILGVQNPGPVALLIDLPSPRHSILNVFGAPKTEAVLDKLQLTRSDVQIHRYNPSWIRRPPRIL